MTTARQQETLDAIEEYWAEHGEGPGINDLATQFGVQRNAIQGHIRALIRQGLVEQPQFGSGRIVLYPSWLREKVKAIWT